MPNTLFYGDNLQVLRDHVPAEAVDLVYLDPPFNSNASYKEYGHHPPPLRWRILGPDVIVLPIG